MISYGLMGVLASLISISSLVIFRFFFISNYSLDTAGYFDGYFRLSSFATGIITGVASTLILPRISRSNSSERASIHKHSMHLLLEWSNSSIHIHISRSDN